jgi:hypothetical protein
MFFNRTKGTLFNEYLVTVKYLLVLQPFWQLCQRITLYLVAVPKHTYLFQLNHCQIRFTWSIVKFSFSLSYSREITAWGKQNCIDGWYMLKTSCFLLLSPLIDIFTFYESKDMLRWSIWLHERTKVSQLIIFTLGLDENNSEK